MTTKNINAPVLIAGGGLVGLSAAMFLAALVGAAMCSAYACGSRDRWP